MKTYTITHFDASWYIMVDGEKKRKKYKSEAEAVAAVRKRRREGDHFTTICSECGDWRYHRHSAAGSKISY